MLACLNPSHSELVPRIFPCTICRTFVKTFQPKTWPTLLASAPTSLGTHSLLVLRPGAISSCPDCPDDHVLNTLRRSSSSVSILRSRIFRHQSGSKTTSVRYQIPKTFFSIQGAIRVASGSPEGTEGNSRPNDFSSLTHSLTHSQSVSHTRRFNWRKSIRTHICAYHGIL